MPSETAEVVAAFGEAVEVVTAEETEEVVETVEVAPNHSRAKPLGELPNIRGPSTRISRLETGPGVVCISAGVGPPFSVPNPGPVHGKTFLLQNNEPVTNSVIQT